MASPIPQTQAEIQLAAMKDFFIQYQNATDHCFRKCITNFNRRILSPTENICIRSCSTKTMMSAQRSAKEFESVYPKMREKQAIEMQKEMEEKTMEALQKQEEMNSNLEANLAEIRSQEGQK